jgi:hypothetical protein
VREKRKIVHIALTAVVESSTDQGMIASDQRSFNKGAWIRGRISPPGWLVDR